MIAPRVDNHLRRGDEFTAQLQVENCQRPHHADQRKRAGDGVRLHHQIDGAEDGDRGEEEEEDRGHSYLVVKASFGSQRVIW